MNKNFSHYSMDNITRKKISRLIYGMPYCAGVNLSNTDLDYYQKIYFQKSWAWWVNHIGTFVVFIIGFFGNLLCLLVLCRRLLRRSSYTQYLIALAIVDSGAIFCEALTAFDEIYQYQSIDKRTLIHHNNFSCKLYYYIRYMFYSMSSWVIVALAIERLVAIKFPLWSKHICTVINARRIIFVILIFTMCIQSYHFIVKGLDCSPSSSTKSSPQNCRCKTILGYAKIDIILTIYVWRLVLMTLLPSAIIITVNTLIMKTLYNENSLADHRSSSGNSRRKSLLLYKISRMLVLLSSVYLLLHVPGSILDILKFIFVNAIRICNTKWQYYISITHDIFDLLTNFNYGINFYLYIISGKHIRNELIYTFKHAKLNSTTHGPNGKRSSYFMSSFIHISKGPEVLCSDVDLIRQHSGSSV